MNTMLVAINAKYIHSNPAIYSLKAYAGKSGEDIILGEYTINNLIDNIIDDIYMKKPDFLGFSTYIWNVEYVMKAACELKKLLPDCRIWLGGPEVTYDAVFLMEKNVFIDGIMCGEGEETYLKVLEYYKYNKGDIKDIAGIVYRVDQKIIDNTKDTLNINMSDIPFIYKELEDFENRIIYYESSRGCPFSCSYCLSSVDKRLRFRDIDLVLRELQFFIDKRVKQVKFVDRTFNCKKSHAMTIWRYIYEHDNGYTNFHFEVAADLIDDEELELISSFRPGLIQLEIGIQSVNEKTIAEINRKMNLDKVRYVVDRINKGKNVLQHLDIIAGLPYEGLEEFKHSFNETYRMRPAELQLGFLKLLSGSLMKERAQEYGMVYRDYPPYEILRTKWISHEELTELKEVEEALEIYYNSMQYVNTMAYLKKYFEEPYDMYKAIADYYKTIEASGNNWNGRKYSRQDRYNILYQFFTNICEEQDKQEIFASILTYDIYLRENAKKRSDFAKDLTEEKQKLRELYRAKQEEGLQNIHIEPFEFDIMSFMRNGQLIKEKQYVVFDYERKNPIDNSAYVKNISV